MNKIICDVCGTSYPDSANQCPICGCVRPATGAAAESAGNEEGFSRRENYTYVKGGRFSKKNVKKRNKQLHHENKNEAAPVPADPEPGGDSSKGLIIAVVVLLIAVIAVAAYITIRFFCLPGNNAAPTETTVQTVDTEPSTEEPTVETTVETVPETVPCTDLTLGTDEVTLKAKDEQYTLSVSVLPEGTTDEITFNSENDAIATVTQEGVITAVTSGETTITVTCGEVTKQCKVICAFNAETGESYVAPYRLNKKSVTIALNINEKFTLKFIDAKGTIIPVEYVIENPEFCSMEGNTVTAVAKGRTNITVNYNGETYTCVVDVVYSH